MRNQPHALAFIGRWDMYQTRAGNGFGICAYDASSGTLTDIGSALPDVTVGAACLHPQLPILYCVDESRNLPGFFRGGGGKVIALAIDPATGAIKEMCRRPSLGSLPCSLAIAAEGDYLLVTHHTDREPITKVVRRGSGEFEVALAFDDASTVLFPLDDQGLIGAARDAYRHVGNGGPLPRQTHPQLHSVTMAPSRNLFAVCDKGNDEIVFFRIDRAAGQLRRLSEYRAPPGSSPRYVAFHPTRPWLFVNHETRAIVSTLRYNDEGHCTHVMSVSALPDDVADHADMKQSDIRVHPSGQFLCSLIRGISAASMFSIDPSSGALTRLQTVSLDGMGPRGCVFSADGRYLHIAALTSNEVLCWSVAADGRLSPTGRNISQPNAGCITLC